STCMYDPGTSATGRSIVRNIMPAHAACISCVMTGTTTCTCRAITTSIATTIGVMMSGAIMMPIEVTMTIGASIATTTTAAITAVTTTGATIGTTVIMVIATITAITKALSC